MRILVFLATVAMAITMVMAAATPPDTRQKLVDTTGSSGNNATVAGSVHKVHKHGRCSFHAVQHEWCDWGTQRSRLTITSGIMDDNHEVMLHPMGNPDDPNDDHEWKDITPHWVHSVWPINLHQSENDNFWTLWVSTWNTDGPRRLEWSYDKCHWGRQ